MLLLKRLLQQQWRLIYKKELLLKLMNRIFEERQVEEVGNSSVQHKKGQRGDLMLEIWTENINESSVLQIEILDLKQFSRYCLQMNDNDVRNRGEPFSILPNPVDSLFSLLVQHFQDFKVTADNCIELEIKQIMMNTEISKKTYRLPTIKEKAENVSELRKRLREFSNCFKQIICKKNQEIKQLKDKNNEIMKELNSSKTILKEQNSKIYKLRQQIHKIEIENVERYYFLKEQIDNAHKSIDSFKEKVYVKVKQQVEKVYQTKMLSIQQKLSQVQQQLNLYIKTYLVLNQARQNRNQQEQQEGQKDIKQEADSNIENIRQGIQIDSHQLVPSDSDSQDSSDSQDKDSLSFPHQNCFTIDLKGQHLRITKITNDKKLKNFILLSPIKKGRKCKASLKLIFSQGRKIYFGIGSKSGFDLQSGYNKDETQTLLLADGYIWEKGSCRSSGLMFSDKESLTMNVDRARSRIKWTGQGKMKMVESIIPKKLNSKDEIFVYVIMIAEGDSVQIMVEFDQ